LRNSVDKSGYKPEFSTTYNTWLPPADDPAEEEDLKQKHGDLSAESEVVAPIPMKFALLRVFTGTWNVGDRPPPYERLKDWFTSGVSSTTETGLPYDILAIGSQECSYKPRAGYESCEKDWASAVTEAVGEEFELVSATSLRDSIRLLLFVRRRLLHQVHSIRSSTYSTTIPMFWRKGGIGVQMSYLSTNLLFISCHLAAHESETTSRNEDVASILKTLGLGNPNYDVGHQFHHCFMMGDLNYRVEGPSWPQTIAQIEACAWPSLLESDQLRKQQQAGNVLFDFQEPNISFAPTFKVSRGSRLNFDRKRIPSWCDRILVHSLPGCSVKSVSYQSVDTILSSDHVPVLATWFLSVPLIRLHYRNETALRTFLCSTSRSPSPFATSSKPTITFQPKGQRGAPIFGVAENPQPLPVVRSDSLLISRISEPSFQLPPIASCKSAEWMVCSEILNPDAAVYKIDLSEVVVALDPIILIKGSSPLNVRPRIVLSSAAMSIEPVKSEPILELEKEWRWRLMPEVTTKPTTSLALSRHHLFIAVYHCWTEGSETLLAHGVTSFQNHLSRPTLFEVPLISCGLRRGTISGILAANPVPRNEMRAETQTDTRP
jgi:endonuclease/exonuclease/phosphatase family metal-dependent hydrolase